MIDVSVVIAHWNAKELLRGCLQSIYRYKHKVTFEVIVVDNNSTDGTVEMIEKEFSQVRLIKNETNRGFPIANNQGIKASRGRYILLLNSDTEIKPDTFEVMVKFLDRKKNAAVVGCKHIYPDGRLQRTAYSFPTLGTVMCETFILDRLFPRSRIFGRKELSFWDYASVRQVDWVMGSCFLVRRKSIEEVGLMAEHYFIWGEDTDWCLRFKRKGWYVYFTPETSITHVGSQSTTRYKGKDYKRWRIWFVCESYKSMDKFYYKFYKNYTGRLIHFIKSAGVAVRLMGWGCSYFILALREELRLDAEVRVIACLRVLKWALKRRKYPGITRELEQRIAIDISPMYRSKAGVGHYTSNLVANLKLLKQNNYIFLRRRRNEGLGERKPSVLKRLFNAVRQTLWEQAILPFRLLVKGATLIHCPAYVSPLIKTCHSIITIHDMAFLLYPEKFVRSYRFYLRLWAPVSARRADVVITDSNQSKKDIVKSLKIPGNKVKVIYLGVDDAFRPITNKKLIEQSRRKYELPPKFILYVGTLEPRKNIMGLIWAYKLFKDSGDKEHRLVIAGAKGWLYSDMFKTVDELHLREDVKFTGYIADIDLPSVYNGAELFVYPSLYEGFGLPPLEAMACGVPVITSNTSSLPEIVGDAGIMVNPVDHRAIADAIKRVLNDEQLKEEMKRKGLVRARQFSWEKTAQRTSEVYNEALSRP